MIRKCQRCFELVFIDTPYCRDCQRWLDAQLPEYEERRVLDFAEIASEALHGRQEQLDRKWWCW